MKERPILFGGPMVLAILEGRKTQTRRVVKGRWLPLVEEVLRVNGKWIFSTFEYDLATPFGEPGDRLWVRETWAPMCKDADPRCYCEEMPAYLANPRHYIEYRADTGNPRPGEWPEPEDGEWEDTPVWKPSIHMPRDFSRINLEITEVRVERLQEISDEDALAEGVGHGRVCPPLEFQDLWDSLAKPGSTWAHNPWIWVIEFRRVAS